MCRFLETIRVENRRLQNPAAHQARVDRTRREQLGSDDRLDLASLIRVPAELGNGVHRCRVVYDRELRSVEFLPYSVRPVRSLQLVVADDLDYAYKYEDRSRLNTLLARAAADDVLIVRRGLITDSSYANLVFSDGLRQLTPATPLLAGTRRAALLAAGRIEEAELRPRDLHLFRSVRLINAMLDLEEGPVVWVEDIYD